MNAPPNYKLIEMTPRDVHENLVGIVGSMDRIRNECATNLGASNGQKTDYLRLAGELSGCIEATVRENRLYQHTEVVRVLCNTDPLLSHYDPLQTEFWSQREPRLRIALDDFTAVLMGDDFVGGNQPYHIFQGVKYGNVNGNRDAVYETILPINPLIGKTLADHNIGVKKTDDGLGISVIIDPLEYVQILKGLGAMYVDFPKKTFQRMKKDFPKTTIVKKDGTEYTRVIFEVPILEVGSNIVNELMKLARTDFGGVEANLVRNILNFHGYGQEFVEMLKDRIGISPKPKKDARKTELTSLIEETSVDSGNKKSQIQWLEYWKQINDGRIMAGMGDLYLSFKELKRMNVEGKDDEKVKVTRYLATLRDDFDWLGKSNWLISSTRLQYNGSNLECKITHHFDCSDKKFVDEKQPVNVPIYRNTPIVQVVSNPEGLKYLQTLFSTEDDSETIIQTLEFISGKNRNKIKVWTAATDGSFTRQSNPERASGLDYNDGCFHVGGNVIIGDAGRSRGQPSAPKKSPKEM